MVGVPVDLWFQAINNVRVLVNFFLERANPQVVKNHLLTQQVVESTNNYFLNPLRALHSNKIIERHLRWC